MQAVTGPSTPGEQLLGPSKGPDRFIVVAKMLVDDAKLEIRRAVGWISVDRSVEQILGLV